MTTFRKRTLLACALVAAVACSDDPTGPGESPDGQLVVGQTVLVRFDSATDAVHLTFQAEADSAYAIEVAPTSGGAVVYVTDSATEMPVYPSDLTVTTSTPARQRYTPVFIAPTTGPYRISLFAIGPTAGRLEVTVHASASGPETIAGAVALGDSTTGEELGTALDVDRFTFTGTAGTYVMPRLHLPGAKNADQAACLRIFSPDGLPLGATIISPGDTVPVTWQHSRTYLPVTGTYRVVVGDGWNGCPFRYPRFYTGAYSFVLATVDTLPESAPATLALGDSVTGEAIGAAGDLDRFTITGTPHALFEVLARRAGGGAGTLQVAIGATKTYLLDPADTAFASTPTGRVAIPDSGKVTMRLSGLSDGPAGDAGPYFLVVHPIDTLPETHAAGITLGDSIVDEVIFPDGDVDRFTFIGVAGGFASFEFRSTLPPFGDPVVLTLTAPDGSTVWGPVDHPVAWDTTARRSGRVALPLSGTYTLRISSLYDGQGPMTRPYRVHTHAIDPAPETLPGTFAFGDTLTGESLDFPGDIDRFRVHVTQPSAARFGFHLDSAAIGSALVRASLVDSANGEVVASLLVGKGESASTPSAYGLAPGTYYLQVTDQGADEASIVGAYQLTSTASSLGPEIAPDSLGIGDTVTTETIAPATDIDRFIMTAPTKQSVIVSLRADGAAGDTVSMFFGPKNQPPILILLAAADGSPLSGHTSARIDLPEAGPYLLDLRGNQAGAYAFAVTPVGIEPEHRPAAFAIGDTVSGESIDSVGEVDRFTMTGTPGQSIGVIFRADTGNGHASLFVSDAATGAGIIGIAGPNSSGTLSSPFAIPASGSLNFRVQQPEPVPDRTCADATCHGLYTYTGAYQFQVVSLDSAPESVPAALVLGDTVAEALEPIGDVDVFTYAGTAGDTISIVVQYLGDQLTTTGILFNVYRPDTDGLIAYGSGSAGEINSTGFFVLPVTGTYRVRVFGNQSWKDHGNYWLLLRGP